MVRCKRQESQKGFNRYAHDSNRPELSFTWSHTSARLRAPSFYRNFPAQEEELRKKKEDDKKAANSSWKQVCARSNGNPFFFLG